MAVLVAWAALLPPLLYAILVCSTYSCASFSLSNQSLYISFLLVLVYVLSGFSYAFIISVMFAVALPLSSNDDVTQ